MLESLTPAAYHKWERYWLDEPWGPWRDNLHVAILGRAFAEPYLKRGARVDMDRFMIRRRDQDAPNRVTNFIRALFRMSKPAKPEKKQ
jgi:hypothetical protein